MMLSVILVGCSTGVSLPPRNLAIEVTEFAVVPSAFSARVGEPLTFSVTNAGVLEHNVSVRDPSGEEIALVTVMPGQEGTFQIVLTTAGEWEIICTLPGHEMAGMKARLTVGA